MTTKIKKEAKVLLQRKMTKKQGKKEKKKLKKIKNQLLKNLS